MSSAGRIAVSLSEADINLILDRLPHGSIGYSQGLLLIEQPLPMGMRASCIAVPFQRDNDLMITVPFDKIRGSGLASFAGALAKTFWKTVSGQIQRLVDEALLRHGLPREAIEVTQATMSNGEKGGLVRISLPHVNYWLASKGGLAPQIINVAFEPDFVHVDLDVRA